MVELAFPASQSGDSITIVHSKLITILSFVGDNARSGSCLFL